MRTALVGCGGIASIHVEALQATPGAQIVALVDKREVAARRLAETAGGRVYTDVSDMIRKERPEIVHILTPPHTHTEIGLAAVNAGAHVFVEKPLATATEDAQRLLAAARASGVVVTTSHNYLYKPSVARARALLAAGVIGDVIDVESYYGVSPDESTLATSAGGHWSWRLRGGVFTNFLPHAIYLAEAFQGPIHSISSVDVLTPDGDDDRTTELVVATRSAGATGRLVLTGRVSPYMKYVDVRGTKGSLRADLVRETCIVNHDNEGPGAVTKVAFNAEIVSQLAYGTALSTFKVLSKAWKSYPGLRTLIVQTHQALENGDAVPISGEQGLQVVEVMEKIWAAAPRLLRSPSMAPIEPEGPSTRTEQRVHSSLPTPVLVTGAAGYLGSRVVTALHRCGVDVRALVREPAGVPFDVERRAEVVVGDLRDEQSMRRAVAGIDTIVHCAAITTNQAPWSAHEAVNVHGTRQLAAVAAAAGVRRLVHVSSVIVYGLNPAGDGPVDEATPLSDTGDPWAFYERSKVGAERALAAVAANSDLETVVVRPGILYGDGRSPGKGFMRFGRTSLTIGSAQNHLPLTEVHHVVDVLLLLLAGADVAGKAYNVVDEPQRRLGELIAEHGRKVPVPAVGMRGAANLLEWRAARGGSSTPPKLSNFVIGTATRDVVYDTTRIRDELGYHPGPASSRRSALRDV